MIQDIIDSYFDFVLNQMIASGAQITLNGVSVAQPFGGVVNARDWPQSPVVIGSLYLLYINTIPIGGTENQTIYRNMCQWVWLLMGDDIGDAQQMQNRGNRFRQDLAIKHNLRNANYPRFCRKKGFSADSQGNISSAFSTSVVPPCDTESIWWSKLIFPTKLENQNSGVTYGTAVVDVFGIDDAIAAVAA